MDIIGVSSKLVLKQMAYFITGGKQVSGLYPVV